MITSKRLAAMLVCMAAWAPLSAGAQAHQTRAGGYTLRSSTVDSTTLPSSVVQAHGFEQKPSVFVRATPKGTNRTLTLRYRDH